MAKQADEKKPVPQTPFERFKAAVAEVLAFPKPALPKSPKKSKNK